MMWWKLKSKRKWNCSNFTSWTECGQDWLQLIRAVHQLANRHHLRTAGTQKTIIYREGKAPERSRKDVSECITKRSKYAN